MRRETVSIDAHLDNPGDPRREEVYECQPLTAWVRMRMYVEKALLRPGYEKAGREFEAGRLRIEQSSDSRGWRGMTSFSETDRECLRQNRGAGADGREPGGRTTGQARVLVVSGTVRYVTPYVVTVNGVHATLEGRRFERDLDPWEDAHHDRVHDGRPPSLRGRSHGPHCHSRSCGGFAESVEDDRGRGYGLRE